MFSRQSADRFEKVKASSVGPGTYELPSTLLEHAPISMEGPERFNENSVNEELGPGFYDPKADDRSTEPKGLASKRQSVVGEKENRAPTPQRKTANRPTTPIRKGAQDTAQKTNGQLEEVSKELKAKKQEAKDLQQQLASRDRKAEELQKRLEEVIAQRKEANRQAAEVESERDAKRRQLHDKEQEVVALQRKNENLRLTAEERGKKLERGQEDLKNAVAEVQRMRTGQDVTKERLETLERDRTLLEQKMKHQLERAGEVEQGLQEHVGVLEESLRREEARRRELEERAAEVGAQAEQGGTELAAERQRTAELQHRVRDLESERTTRIASEMELKEKQCKCEDQIGTLTAERAAQADALARAREQVKEVETRAAKAEALLGEKSEEYASVKAKLADLEEETKRYGEAQYRELAERFEDGEAKVKAMGEELREERQHVEDLEARVAMQESELESRPSEPIQIRDPEIELKLQRAEEELACTCEEVKRWKEWADEQSLREITAETKKLEEINRVREDMSRQVEEARKEVLEENKALQKRMADMERLTEEVSRLKGEKENLELERADLETELGQLKRTAATVDTLKEQLEKVSASAAEDSQRAALGEASLDAARKELAEVRQKCADQRDLEARLARAEADAAVASEELAEERERVDGQLRALRIEHETTLAVREEGFENARLAERETARQCQQELEEGMIKSRSRANATSWHLFVELAAQRHATAVQHAQWAQVRKAAHEWRKLAKGHEHDGDLLERQGEELTKYHEENEALVDQNRELMASLRNLQQDLQVSLVETKRLQDREASYERELERMSDRGAELNGHSNHKQKIKYLESLKDENNQLRQELKRAKQSAAQYEAQARASNFFESTGLAVEPVGARTPSRRGPSPHSGCMTPGRPSASVTQPMTPKRGDAYERERDPLAAYADERPEALRRERAEAVRHAKAHRRASERAALEYQHLHAVVEQVLFVASRGVASGDTSTAQVPTQLFKTPERPRGMPNSGPADALFRRLRELSTSFCARGEAQKAQTPPLSPRSIADAEAGKASEAP